MNTSGYEMQLAEMRDRLEAANLREAELASALEIARTALKAYAPTDKWHENTASIALERSRNPSAAHAEREK